MRYVNIHDAKSNLSKYLEQISSNHETIIICKSGKPIAQLSEYKPPATRKLGLWKGQVEMADDFNDLPEDWKKYFE